LFCLLFYHFSFFQRVLSQEYSKKPITNTGKGGTKNLTKLYQTSIIKDKNGQESANFYGRYTSFISEHISRRHGNLENARLIDLGCGDGLIAFHLKEKSLLSYDGVDTHQAAVHFGRELQTKVGIGENFQMIHSEALLYLKKQPITSVDILLSKFWLDKTVVSGENILLLKEAKGF